MPYQNLNVELREGDKNEIINFINRASQMMPFLINLTPEEKHELPKMGDKTIAFVERAIQLAQQNPNLIPPYLNVDEMKRDFELSKSLKEILGVAASLYEKINDTYIAAGSEAYVAALQFYNSVKNAAKSNVPGSDSIVDELGKRFTFAKSKQQSNNSNTQS